MWLSRLGLLFTTAISMAFASETIHFDYLDESDGLSHGVVNTMAQDKTGFMWFGTQDGLNRYDGYRFQVYRHSNDRPGSLASNDIFCSLYDSQGRLWIGSLGGGLDRYRENSDDFEHINLGDALPDMLDADHILSLTEGLSGRIWVGTRGSGIVVIENDDSKHPLDTRHGLPHQTIWKMLLLRSGAMLIGTESGLARVEKGGSKVEVVDQFNGIAVRALYEHDDGILWVGTWGEGLMAYDRAADEVKKLSSISDEFIRDIWGTQGDVWVATQRGLNRWDRESEAWSQLFHNPGDLRSLRHDYVLSLFVCRAGILWLGSPGKGVSRLSPIAAAMRHGQIASADSQSINAIADHKNGALWIAKDDGVVVIESGQLELGNGKVRDELRQKKVTALHTDDRGWIWIGTSQDGLYRYENDRSVVRVDGFHAKGVTAIKDATRGDVWIASENEGLFRWSVHHRQYAQWQNDAAKNDSLASNQLNCLEPDANGVWVGTSNRGLDYFDGTVFTHIRSARGRFDQNAVHALLRDQDVLWVATSRGFTRLVLRGTNVVDHVIYDHTRGLRGNQVFGVVKDRMGMIWLSTDKGLSRLEPRTDLLVNYDLADGLQGLTFHPGAYLNTLDGQLYFGGSQGYNRFDPGDLPQTWPSFSLVATAIRVGNRKGMHEFDDQAKEILIEPKNDRFEVEVAMLDFTKPKQNQFRHRLLGFDRDWKDSHSNPLVIYQGLEPGRYGLEVEGINAYGVKARDTWHLEVEVQPPFWKTRLATSLFTLIIVFIIFVIPAWKILTLKRHVQTLNEQMNELQKGLNENGQTGAFNDKQAFYADEGPRAKLN